MPLNIKNHSQQIRNRYEFKTIYKKAESHTTVRSPSKLCRISWTAGFWITSSSVFIRVTTSPRKFKSAIMSLDVYLNYKKK